MIKYYSDKMKDGSVLSLYRKILLLMVAIDSLKITIIEKIVGSVLTLEAHLNSSH